MHELKQPSRSVYREMLAMRRVIPHNSHNSELELAICKIGGTC